MMRLETVRLSWFRGAGQDAALNANGSSMVVYGDNGAGKSSFVDGVEACVGRGKVSHLSHEYSGRYQEKGIINTHRPAGAETSVGVKLANVGDEVTYHWARSGAPRAGGPVANMETWDYRRIALRQDEMATFIKSTKAEKYSALLPLLGLQHLEVIAENLRKLAKETATLSRLSELRGSVEGATRTAREMFGETADVEVGRSLSVLQKKYAGSVPPPTSAREIVKTIQTAIADRINLLDAQSREAAALEEVNKNSSSELIRQARSANSAVAAVAEPLVKERLEILTAAARFHEGLLIDSEMLTCPACGSQVSAGEFRVHITNERSRLENAQELITARTQTVSKLCDEVQRIRSLLSSPALANWKASQGGDVVRSVEYLQKTTLDQIRSRCTEDDLDAFESNLSHIFNAAGSGSSAPSKVQDLIDDKARVGVIDAYLAARTTAERVKRIEILIGFISALEEEVRHEIRDQAYNVFDTISKDIQLLWDVLHPGKRITNVRLHVPKEADKAIDVALTFYGVEQESPRLTLSEGQRNGLGLCIFLAMAKQDAASDRPILLDDVVVSLDRDHRSEVAKLLEQEFANRQIIILTHDREWFFELSRFLKPSRWAFKRLLPWQGPEVGIQFAEHGTDLEKAKAKIEADPEDAESNVRRIMDQALSEIAEALHVPVPHLRGSDNDRRTGGEFITRIIGRAKKSFRIRDADGAYERNENSIQALEAVAPQLAVWANRATHTFSASKNEAKTVVDNCERALESFDCDTCHKPVWLLENKDGAYLQCACGKLQWKE